MEKNTGKKFITQGKLRENTGNFISAGMWPPWNCYTEIAFTRLRTIICLQQTLLELGSSTDCSWRVHCSLTKWTRPPRGHAKRSKIQSLFEPRKRLDGHRPPEHNWVEHGRASVKLGNKNYKLRILRGLFPSKTAGIWISASLVTTCEWTSFVNCIGLGYCWR